MNASKNIETEIFVVDNNSTDGSKQFFEGQFNNVKFIWNTDNIGFSSANNIALKQATGYYILFLNPDTILPEDCLEKCITCFQQYDGVGAMGIKMIDGTGRFLKESKRGFPSPFVSFYKISGLTTLFPKSTIFARYYLGHLDENKNQEVDVLAGAFMLIKKSVLEITGGFDERFFMYGEDIDLSYRIQKAGYKNIYYSESTILHFKGESTKRGSINYIRSFYGAMSLFVKKHYSKGFAWFYNLLIQPAIGIKAFLSYLGNWLTGLTNQKKEQFPPKNCLIIADKNEFDFIKQVLEKSNSQQNVAGRISLNYLIEADAIGNLNSLSQLIAVQKIKLIVFSINHMSAKLMIERIQALTGEVEFMFHYKGSTGFVGSKQNVGSLDNLA